MPARAVLEHEVVAQARLAQTECAGTLGQIRERVELGDAFGRLLERGEPAAERLEQRVIELFLAAQRSLARGEHLVLELLELGRDVALGVLQRLAADVISRRAGGLRLAQLDIEAVHAVVADLEPREPGALALALLEPLEVLVGVRADGAQLVEV